MMHITKNVTESLLGTLSNMSKKAKNGTRARYDLKWLGVRKDLQAPDSDDDMMMIRRKGLKVAAKG